MLLLLLPIDAPGGAKPKKNGQRAKNRIIHIFNHNSRAQTLYYSLSPSPTKLQIDTLVYFKGRKARGRDHKSDCGRCNFDSIELVFGLVTLPSLSLTSSFFSHSLQGKTKKKQEENTTTRSPLSSRLLLFSSTSQTRKRMDLQDVYSAWAADASAPGMATTTMSPGSNGGGPLKLAGGAEAASLGGSAAAGAGTGAAGPRTSSGFMLTADCSAGGALAPRAPAAPAPAPAPAPALPPAAAVAAPAAANNNAAAPFCFLPGTAGAGNNNNAGARSPESEATRLNNTSDFQQHLMLPCVAVRAPTTTTSSPEASSVAVAAVTAPAPPAPSSTTATSYDFATVYALLGSLFDPACAGIDHAAALAQMPRGEREVAGVWLRYVAAHLSDPAAMAGHAAALTEATLADRTTAVAAAAAGLRQQQ